jgi:ElaA protein
VNWILKRFEDLNSTELYAILRLRNEVFVLEQNCVYMDTDNIDQRSWHFCGWNDDKLLAYTRIIPAGICYEDPSIGRVVVSSAHRKEGLGRELMTRSIEQTFGLFGHSSISIGAQVYLEQFYTSLGFESYGDRYLEDGIPHIKMQLKKQP